MQNIVLNDSELMGRFVHERHRKAAALFRRHLPSQRRLLDIGCGTGVPATYMKSALGFAEIYGVDIDKAAIEAAKSRGIKAFRCNLDQEDLPFEQGYFDAIFAGEIIEHLVNPDRLLQEAHRTLAADGMLVVTTPNLASWFNRLLLLFGWQPYETGTSFYYEVGRPNFLRLGSGMGAHLHLYTLRGLRELIVAHKFEIVEVVQASAREKEREIGANRWRWLHQIGFLVDRMMILAPGMGHRLVVAARSSARVPVKVDGLGAAHATLPSSY